MRIQLKIQQQQNSMVDLEKRWKHILNRYRMNQAELFPQSIAQFQEFMEYVRHYLLLLVNNDKKYLVVLALEKLIEMINKSVQKITLNCIVKKLAILHTWFHKQEEKSMRECFKTSISEQLKIIMTKNLEEITAKESQNRESSISKVQNLLRKLSGSKQKNKSKGKMNIENQKEKGAIVQIVQKIVTPFCLYFMKILEDIDTYSEIKDNEKEFQGVVIWKIVNWSKILGKVILQINRLGHYFKEDMLAFIVYFNFLIGQDISNYYDIIWAHVERETQRWRILIELEKEELQIYRDRGEVEQINLEKLKGQRKWIQIPQLCQLKQLILQMRCIKQKLNYVYGSSLLMGWQKYFPKPSKFSFRQIHIQEELNIDFILELFQKEHRSSCKKQQRSNTQKQQTKHSPSKRDSVYVTLQTKESPQKFGYLEQSESGNGQIFAGVGQSALVMRTQKRNAGKSRLNKLMQSIGQKQKLVVKLQTLVDQVVSEAKQE